MYIAYEYVINGKKALVAEALVELTNELIEVVAEPVVIDWSAAIDATYDGTKTIIRSAEYNSDYNVGEILGSAHKQTYINGVETSAANKDIIRGRDKDGKLQVELYAGYEFPEYGTETPNIYSAKWVVDHDNKTFTVMASVVLNPIPVKEINVEVSGLDFSLVGTDTFYSANANFMDPAYEQFKGYLGEVTKADFIAMFEDDLGSDRVIKLKDNKVVLTAITSGTTAEEIKESDVTSFNHGDVKFNFTAKGSRTPFINALKTEPKFVDSEGTVMVEGVIADHDNDPATPAIYTVNDANLSNYLSVSGAISNNLKVKYQIISETTVPTLSITEVNVIEDELGKVTFVDSNTPANPVDAIVHWNNYDGLEVKVKATLYANGFIADEEVLTIKTEKPLTFSISDFSVDRTTSETPAYVYKNFKLTSILAPATNLFNTDTTSDVELSTRYTLAAETYGAIITVGLVSVSYEVGEDEYFCGSNDYTWDPDKGVITFTSNSGQLLYDIKAKFNVTFESRLDGTTTPESKTLTVTFKK